MRRIHHPSGSDHWTRAHPEKREPWTKLSPEELDELVARFIVDQTSQSELARMFRLGRTTVWRYLKARGLIGEGVSFVSRGTGEP